MSVSRIQELDIDNRSLITGIYGLSAANEFYVDKDLCRYFLWEELYLYLHEKGYITVFYSIDNNLFSYQERDLELFLRKIEMNDGHSQEPRQQTSPHRRHPRCRGPLGVTHPHTPSNSSPSYSSVVTPSIQPADGQSNAQGLQSHHPDIMVGGDDTKGKFYMTVKRMPGLAFLERCFRYVDDYKERKLAVVFTTPESSEVNTSQYADAWAMMQPFILGHGKANLPLRFLVLYTKPNAYALHDDTMTGSFFFSQSFKDLFFSNEQNEHGIEINQHMLFRIGHPGLDEIGNVLNKLRIEKEGLTSVFNLPFEELCLRIWQQFKIKDPTTGEEREIDTVKELIHLPIPLLEEAIIHMDTEKALNKLKRMPGLEKLLEQFDRYRKAYRRYQEEQKQGINTARFRAHMAFLGNPGTGKTTVARLFADVLREEGFLSRGHLVTANVNDLISSYLGATREQTRALCEKAQGGVLFLDEAYGLMSGANNNGNLDYGKEAIEVLIQFMENNDDFLVIIAGYTDEINNLINYGNQGFRSRFNTELGIFNFEDYRPDVLYQIARKKLPQSVKTTGAFDKALRGIIETMYAFRNKNFGNAREMENLVSNIINAYYDNNSDEPLDIKHIPDKFRILADPNMLDEDSMLAELNDTIVGQKNIKALVKELFEDCLGQRTKMVEFGDTPEPRRLNYVFLGNPGTGKTTVARIIGNLLQKLGILISPDKSVLTEISGGDMTDMAPEEIKKLFEDNIGKVLFIDEAYELRNNPRVIGEIVANATNPNYAKKMCIIMAGYTAEMRGMMNTNPGMKRRFDTVTFQDYTNEELWEILKRKANDKDSQCLMDEAACEQVAINYFATQPRGRDFGNAGIVESLLSVLKSNRDKRYNAASANQKKSISFARTILPEDFPVTRKRARGKVLPPRERLQTLQGIDKVREQFQRYCNAYHAYLEGEAGESFRPHMAFMGNPGTGKTTVARLFGAILHEEGFLPQGQFIEATIGDLVGQYIGETRVKASALCDRAKGGVLFIDEAYGLMSGTNAHGNVDFGQEAIEVLIQFMENNDDSLVILAGYPEETKRLINEGNPGFKSRFNENLGFFYFEDYEPDVLYEIARGSIPKSINTTEAFDKALRNIVELKYAYRTKVFGNARDMENLAGTIASAYYESGGTGDLDVSHLPDNLRVLVDPSMLNESTMLAELNDKIVGQNAIREIVENLYEECKAEREKMSRLQGYRPAKQRLNYIFVGNPGTGKTTIARIIGNLLQKMGVLSSSDNTVLTEVSGSEVAHMNPGQVDKLFEENIGKVLFIDEAYELRVNPLTIAEIVKNATNPDYEKKMCIILAGYTKQMHDMMRINSGIASRFTEVEFQDYTDQQLWEILKRKVYDPSSKFTMDATACEETALSYFSSLTRGRDFGNARIIGETLLPILFRNRDKRYNNGTEEQRGDPDFAKRILPEDFPQRMARSRMSDEEVLKELNSLVGLKNVKKKLQGIIDDVKAQSRRSRMKKTKESKMGLNFVFRGNPGTGKTTVARLLGNILANYGLIKDPQVVTYTKSQLVDRYVGSGSQNVERMFEESVGKVLFIDEAYELADSESKSTLDTLTNMMTDERFKDQLAIIIAGYQGNMAELLNKNPGLSSRFTQYVDFENYTNEELTEIFCKKAAAEGFVINNDAMVHAKAYFSTLKRDVNFANAREAVNLLQEVRAKLSQRTLSMTEPTGDELFTVLPSDFPNYGRINVEDLQPRQELTPMEKLEQLMGMENIQKKFKAYLRAAHYCKNHPQDPISKSFRPHMAFLGNPGTGKTTVARLFGEILLEEGLLTSKNFVEISPDELIGEFVGQSAPKARRQFERARGGILFVDEAYELFKKGKDGGGNQFGQEVVTALIKFMEDDRDTIVVLAGYTDELRHLIKYGNPGLKSRVTNEFVFEDYQPDILFKIFINKLGSRETTEQFKADMRQIIQYEFVHRDEKQWGNARTMENYAFAIFENYLSMHDDTEMIDSDSIPDDLRQGLMQDDNRQGINTTTAESPSQNADRLFIDLTTNPADRKVASKRQLREQATGLLHSSGGEGTGFIISIPDRYIMTCSHVIEDTESDIFFRMNCNKEFETMAHVVWNNHDQDMALLQLDEMPEDACYVQIDCDIEHNPDPSDAEEKIKLLLCSYPAGSDLASTPSFSEGKINNFEKQRHWNERCFDTILTSINATHGCSGGPVVRESDFMLVGLLQGGKVDTNIQFITDIHQLFKNKNLDIKS